MGVFWLVSVPRDESQAQWNRLQESTKGLSSSFKFNLPGLKVGTLDALMCLSDELAKLDVYTETIMQKVYHYMANTLENNDVSKLPEYSKCNNKDLRSYCGTFVWDVAKFPTKLSIKDIHDIIAKNMTKMEKDFRAKSSTYNNLKQNLSGHEKRESGSLVTRNLGPLLNEEDFVQQSEYLVTVCVVVPKSQYRDWEREYEGLADFVVPRSSKLVLEDADQGIYTVTMFRKTLEAFKNNAREKKYTVRDFQYSKENIETGLNERKNLEKAQKKAYVPLIRWLKGNFSEAFINWMHVKALRLFTESVLRYGLPANFLTVMLEPNKKVDKKLREKLYTLYSSLDKNTFNEAPEIGDNIPGIYLSGDYYPYVYFDVNTNFIDVPRD